MRTTDTQKSCNSRRQLFSKSLFSLLLVAASSWVSAASSGNLIINGDGESGVCTTDFLGVNALPGWKVIYGNPTNPCYTAQYPSGYSSNLANPISFTTPSSPAKGNSFIANGPYGDAVLAQTVDVSSAATTIDRGSVTYTLSTWFGQSGGYKGESYLTATFLDQSGNPLGTSAEINNGKYVGSNKNQFVTLSNTGSVPAGTRSINVQMQFVNSQNNNGGFADNTSLTLSTAVTAPQLTVPASTVPQFDHVFIVMEENTDFSFIIGDTVDAPFINSLAQNGAVLTNMYGTYHPSDENYLAVAGGNNFVSGPIYWPNIQVTNQHLGDKVEAAGKTWKSYEQGMGTPCNLNTNYDSEFAPDEAPFINFTNISGNPTRCAAHLVDLSQLNIDLASAATTPNFAWIAADVYYEGEGAASGNGAGGMQKSVQVQDGWLQQTLQPIFNSPAWKTQKSLLIVTWDESWSGGTTSEYSNHIATILYSSQGLVGAGSVSNNYYNHYNTSRTIQSALGLTSFGQNDQYAEAMNDAFGAKAPVASNTLKTLLPNVAKGGYAVTSYTTSAANKNAANWIGIYAQTSSAPTGTALMSQTVADQGGVVSFDTSKLAPGNYSAWLFYNGGFTPLAGPVNFKVSP